MTESTGQLEKSLIVVYFHECQMSVCYVITGSEKYQSTNKSWSIRTWGRDGWLLKSIAGLQESSITTDLENMVGK